MRYLVFCLFFLSCSPKNTDFIPIASAAEDGYDRSDWGRWKDFDKDCQDTRQEVLIRQSEVPVEFKDDSKCKVLVGKWTCPYTGQVFTSPSDLDIDHVVPLREAHDSGGSGWEKDKKVAYFNNLDNSYHLIATSASSNRSKGAKDPFQWMPENKDTWCIYLKSWVQVKKDWELVMDNQEVLFIAQNLAEFCVKSTY